MSGRKVPVLPTIVVVAAAAVMVWLGFWQLGKVDAQDARLAQYEAAEQNPAAVTFPVTADEVDRYAYRRSEVDCRQVTGEPRSVAGRNARNQTGYVLIANCTLANGQSADVQLGWSAGPIAAAWQGGRVAGTIEPLRTGFAKLVADPPVAGLEANAAPAKHQINHLAYAVQWFFFALTALVIYCLALRKRWR